MRPSIQPGFLSYRGPTFLGEKFFFQPGRREKPGWIMALENWVWTHINDNVIKMCVFKVCACSATPFA